MIPLIGFAPDVDPVTPGVITDCRNIDPLVSGFAASPSMSSSGLPALPDVCIGANLASLMNGTHRFIAGTASALFEATGTNWTDRSVAGGYTAGTDARWRFAQMGDAIIAADQADTLQASLPTQGFAPIAGAPKARIVEAVAGFIFAFATVDPTYGDQSDRWWCSALYDYTDWTPAAQTQCATGRFLESPGEVRGAKALGKNIVAYKERAMFLGTYLGSPVIWDWQQIPGEIGAYSHECIVSIGTAHFFVGARDFWMFDGSRPVSIGSPLRDWFFSNVNEAYLYRIQGYYDQKSGLVYWYYVSKSSAGLLDACITYNVKTNRWGQNTRAIETVVNFSASDVTYDQMGDLYATFDDITGITYDSPRWFQQNQQSAVFDSTHTPMILAGNALPSSITTGDVGDDTQYSTLSGVKCRFRQQPDSGTMTHLHKSNEGLVEATGAAAILSDSRFDIMASDRWHRARLDFTGRMTMTDIDFMLIADGTR